VPWSFSALRFDDSLTTVLAADMTPGAGAEAAWRQLVDLTGRGRIAADAETLVRLSKLRAIVPPAVRAASARALAAAQPDAALVEFFADDEPGVAAPVLRHATLEEAAWLKLLPRLSPAGRSVLRSRRDLPDAVERGLESLGAIDFTLPSADLAPEPAHDAAPVPLPDAPLSPTSFLAVGDVARSLPVVAEALRRIDEPAVPASRFEIADIVARIDAFRRDKPPELPVKPLASPSFHFVTDAAGTIRWVDGVTRTTLVGVSLARADRQALAQVDAGVAGAVRGRQRFSDARLQVDGTSDAAGSWRIAGVPDFDAASGRFIGYRGVGRRPARHERAEASASDQLRQLVHELRTPVGAVSGFAELIETELLGPVPPVYRGRAGTIRGEAGQLLAAIDDLDTAARIDGSALQLTPAEVPLAPLIDRIVDDLRPLADLRGAHLAAGGERASVVADDRALERLLARLLATLVAAAEPGERIGIDVRRASDRVLISADRPRALTDVAGDVLFALDDAAAEGGPLLGAGFTLRLVRNLAAELGGALSIDRDALTLRLPAALIADMGQVATR
jgi:signal transduction histidine kinase